MTKNNKAAVIAAALIFASAAPAMAQGTTATDTGVVTDTRDRDGDDDSGKWGLLGLLGLAGLLGLKRRDRDDHRDNRSTTGTTTGSRH
jgi:MYXO-CTERM domain-containing protein